MTRRVLTAVLAVATLAVIAFSVPAALAIRSAQERGALLELQREASIAASRIPAMASIDASALQPIIDSELRLALYAPGGALAGGTGPRAADPIVELALAGNYAEGRIAGDLVAAVPVSMRPDGSIWAIRIEAPASYNRNRFARSVARLAVAGISVIAIAGGVGVWLSRRLARPITDLRRWAGNRHRPDQIDTPPAATGIGEVDSLRAALLDDQARIAELLQRERSFSSQVSHQLRTPVAAMRVAIETELDLPRPDRASILDESLDQLDRLESTINSLLALARHDPRPARATELVAFASERVDRWRRDAGACGRTIAVRGGSLTVRTDPETVGHIVDIVIDNSIRHGAGAVSIDVRAADDEAVIDIADEGAAPHDRDPFADQASDTGHGIGLRLARSLAESAGGRLELLPQPTTTFRLSLPLAAPAS